MQTGVIVLNYNNSSDTINCIESILKVNTASIKIIIVDNGSKIDDVEFLKEYINTKPFSHIVIRTGEKIKKLPQITLLLSDNNLGYANGNNLGLSIVDEDEDIDDVLIVNNDILFTEDIIPVLKEKYSKLDKCGILSPLLYGKDGVNIDFTCARKSPSDWVLLIKYLLGDLNVFDFSHKIDAKCYLLKSSDDLMSKNILKVDLPSGSCMFINKNLFKEIGWFDSNTFLYYEENILYAKMSAYNKKNYILPYISCIHLGASSTKSKPSSFLIKCNSDSAFYYLAHYCNLNIVQKILLSIAKKVMFFKYMIFKFKENK